ncbi:MAG TPA: hypothetical protein VIM09_01160 [Chthoniobacterales bacterium]
MNNRHGATRPSRPQLLAEHTVLPDRDWSVVEPAGIDRNLVPTVKGIQTRPGAACALG